MLEITTLLPLAVFGLFAIGAWVVMETLSAKQARAEERLDELRNPRLRKAGLAEGGASKKKSDGVASLLAKASPALSRPLQPKSDEEVGKLKKRLSAAGFRSENATGMFLSTKFFLLLAGFVLAGGPSIFLHGFTTKALGYTVIGAGFAFYLPDIIVFFIAKSRKDSIFLSLPDALDLLVVCVEAGLGLDQAMRRVADELGATYRVIADEFSLCNFQLQMGRTRADVLHELGSRTDVDDLRSLAAILVQADKFGSSIAQALRVQSEAMRTRRSQIAEEKAAKTAVKLIFPLVIFIFPAIFVVLVGPAAITMVNEMFPAMQGQ